MIVSSKFLGVDTVAFEYENERQRYSAIQHLSEDSCEVSRLRVLLTVCVGAAAQWVQHATVDHHPDCDHRQSYIEPVGLDWPRLIHQCTP